MPEEPSRRLEAANNWLDAQALRHLVTNLQIAKAIWGSGRHEEIRQALAATYGLESVHITRLVSQQSLLTVLRQILSKLKKSKDDTHVSFSDAIEVTGVINIAVKFPIGDEDITEEAQYCLLCAWIHAAVGSILGTRRDDIKARYRFVMDVIRRKWSSRERVLELQESGILCIKEVVHALDPHTNDRKRRRRETLPIAKHFYDEHPRRQLLKTLSAEVTRISDWLPEMTLFKTHESRTRQVTGKRGALQSLADRNSVPRYFSDAEDSEIEAAEDDSESNDRWNRKRPPKRHYREDCSEDNRAEEVERAVDKRCDDIEADGLRNHVRKGIKRSSLEQREDVRTNAVEEQPRRAKAKGKGLPWQLRSRKQQVSLYKEDSEEMTDLEPREREHVGELTSQDFQSSGGESGELEHVARHTTSRRGARTVKPNTVGKRGSVIVKAEPRTPDRVDDEDSGNTTDIAESGQGEADRAAVSGRAGAAVRDLHELTSNLRYSGIPDPLVEAQKDARNVRHRARRSLAQMYSPTSEARVASPIPESEVRMRRKKKRNFQLEESSSSERPNPARRSKLRENFQRRGRFQPYEDDLLITGLRKHGWGMWTAIAKDFGDHEGTRAPMSLKDRARTLELDPTKYPLPSSAVKRGRPPKRLPRSRNHRNSDQDSEDEDSVTSDSDNDDDETT